jgi:hypothetical protein
MEGRADRWARGGHDGEGQIDGQGEGQINGQGQHRGMGRKGGKRSRGWGIVREMKGWRMGREESAGCSCSERQSHYIYLNAVEAGSNVILSFLTERHDSGHGCLQVFPPHNLR